MKLYLVIKATVFHEVKPTTTFYNESYIHRDLIPKN